MTYIGEVCLFTTRQAPVKRGAGKVASQMTLRSVTRNRLSTPTEANALSCNKFSRNHGTLQESKFSKLVILKNLMMIHH
jgi:hypothetical protein